MTTWEDPDPVTALEKLAAEFDSTQYATALVTPAGGPATLHVTSRAGDAPGPPTSPSTPASATATAAGSRQRAAGSGQRAASLIVSADGHMMTTDWVVLRGDE